MLADRDVEGGRGDLVERSPAGVQLGDRAADRLAPARLTAGQRGDDLLPVAGEAVPGGDAVAPPELARDAPGADVLHPLQVDGGGALGHDADFAVADDAGRLGREPGRIDEPLVGDERLDHDAGALRVGDVVDVRLFLDEVAVLAQVIGHEPARLVAVHFRVEARFRRQRAVPVDGGDRFQAVPLADLEVELVVSRRDLERAGAELGIDGVVGDDRHQPLEAAQRQADEPSVVRLPAFIFGMHGDGDVGRDRLGPRRRDGDAVVQLVALVVDERVADVPELALFLLVLDLDVGERGEHLRVPGDDAVAAVDLAVAVQVGEGLAHRFARRAVEGEDEPIPVAGSAHPPRLRFDPRAVAPDPGPDALDEFLAAEVVAGEPFLGDLLLDDGLGGDAGVVEAGQPERRLAEHAVPADQRVLDRDRERVAEMQRARDVGWRHDDREGVALGVRGGREPAAFFPEGVDGIFGGGGIVGLGQAGIGGHGRRSIGSGRCRSGEFGGPAPAGAARA